MKQIMTPQEEMRYLLILQNKQLASIREDLERLVALWEAKGVQDA